MNPSSSATPDTSRVKVREGGEIIISAGAFNTPQLLKQSGIGPKEELTRFDLPVHVDLAGVGENMQDRYEVGIETKFKSKLTKKALPFIEKCNYVVNESDLCYSDWAKDGKGLYGMQGSIVSLLKRSGMTEDSDLHMFGLPGPFRGYAPGYSMKVPLTTTRNVFTWAILKGHTNNRGGTVKLRCAKKDGGKCVVDPRATPVINFHYFSEGVEYDELNTSLVDSKGEQDLEAVVRAIKIIRNIQDTTNRKLTLSKAVESWPGDNFAPGESFDSEDAKLREFVKREAWGHHASCSAPTGCIPGDEVGAHNAGAGVCKDTKFNPNTVLDSRLRVRGTKGLRVVDASAFPRIPGTFPLLAIFMLSEKGAKMILQDLK